MYELRADGTSEWHELSLRELLKYIRACVQPLSALTPEWHTRRDRLLADTPRESPGSTPRESPGSTPKPSAANSKRLGSLIVVANSQKTDSGKLRRMHVHHSHLHTRDLRQLFSANSASEPAIAVRWHVVLFNFETIRAIVLVDRLILLVSSGAGSELQDIERELNTEHEEVLEFETRAYETLLHVSSLSLVRELKFLEPKVKAIVMLMEQPGSNAATSAEANDKFRSLLSNVNELVLRVKARRRAFMAVLMEDADMALMNLTKMRDHPTLYALPLAPEVEKDHGEVELLLDNFLQDTNTLANVLESMDTRLTNTNSLIQVKLDIARNRLLTASTIFTMITMFLGYAAAVTGIFGMNLNDAHQDSRSWFDGVAISLAVVFVVGNLGVYYYFDRKGIWVS